MTGQTSRSRRRLFIVGALLIPFVLMLVLELTLVVIGFADTRLFVDYPSWPGHKRANPEVANRYLPKFGEPISWIDPFLFEADKPSDGVRLVVQGGSTAAGFPYGQSGGLAGMLGDRLEAAHPQGSVEVISTAMAAVNSHTLLDLVDEIIAIEPDAVLIYAGHNEYVGLLGIGSALTGLGSSEWVKLRIAVSRSRIVQAVQRSVSCLAATANQLAGREPRTLFAQAADASLVPFGSESYRAGLDQFERNLDELLGRYREAGIPVYVGTLVSNDADLAPLRGGPRDGVDRQAWAEAQRSLARARAGGQLEAERRAVQQLLELDPNAADAWFALGRLEHKAGRKAEARAALAAARDRDQLRLRAPSAMNEIVRRLAARHGATVVEVEERFRAASGGGVVGSELLLEHVHPNGEGYFLLADVFFDALREDGVLGAWADASNRAAAKRDMPITVLDRLAARYSVMKMLAGFPFGDGSGEVELPEPRGEVERIAQAYERSEMGWLEANERLRSHFRSAGQFAEAARFARAIAREYPTEHAPNLAAGLMLARADRPAWARRYLERALRAQPDDVSTLAALLRADRALDDRASAARRAEALRQLRPDHPLLAPPARR